MARRWHVANTRKWSLRFGVRFDGPGTSEDARLLLTSGLARIEPAISSRFVRSRRVRKRMCFSR